MSVNRKLWWPFMVVISHNDVYHTKRRRTSQLIDEYESVANTKVVACENPGSCTDNTRVNTPDHTPPQQTFSKKRRRKYDVLYSDINRIEILISQHPVEAVENFNKSNITPASNSQTEPRPVLSSISIPKGLSQGKSSNSGLANAIRSAKNSSKLTDAVCFAHQLYADADDMFDSPSISCNAHATTTNSLQKQQTNENESPLGIDTVEDESDCVTLFTANGTQCRDKLRDDGLYRICMIVGPLESFEAAHAFAILWNTTSEKLHASIQWGYHLSSHYRLVGFGDREVINSCYVAVASLPTIPTDSLLLSANQTKIIVKPIL